MADMFLKLDGISGESQEAGHIDEIDVLSWTWDVNSDSRYLSGSGGGAGKASMTDLEIVHAMDRASPNLLRYALEGRCVAKAVLSMRKPGGLPLDFQKITMENVRVTGVKPIGSNGIYLESVKLSFSKFKHEYTLQNELGGSKGVVTASFDLRANRDA